MHQFTRWLIALSIVTALTACNAKNQALTPSGISGAGAGGVGAAGLSGTTAGTSAGGASGMVASAGTSGGSGASGSGSSQVDGGPDADVGGTTGGTPKDADCDMNGIWLAQQITVNIALGASQYGNNYYYLEIKQDGTNFEVTKSISCGTVVQGSATVILPDATTKAIMAHNSQAGRKGTMAKNGAACDFNIDHFWQVRGLPEADFVPNPRNSTQSLTDFAAMKPLPTEAAPGPSEDWDNDGHPGIQFIVSGAVNGTRDSIGRDWSWWYSDATANYTITPAANWTSDLLVRTQYDSEEAALWAMGSDAISTMLLKGGAPTDVMNKDARVKLRFLGRNASDPRVAAFLAGGATDPVGNADGTLTTCKNLITAMPAETTRM